MAIVFPFRAVFPLPDMAPQVSAPPYDVVSTQEAVAAADGKPWSFFHVSRAEIDLPDGTDPHSKEVYETALANYIRLRLEVPLCQETEPVFYVYAQRLGAHRQCGIVATLSVDEYECNVIKKHERTRQDKEDDRTRHILTLRSQTGPVFLTYRPDADVDALVARIVEQRPFVDFVAEDGVGHTVWRITAPEDIQAVQMAFDAVPSFYIADGHHRAASAARVRETLRDENPAHTGEEEYNRFLGVLFPANQVRILPYNRLVKDLNGLTPAQFLEKCAGPFALADADSATPAAPGIIHLFIEGRWRRLTCRNPRSAASPVDRLDVSLLQNLVLAPVLGIDDPRTSPRIEFVGGIRGTKVLEEQVQSGAAAVAFSMCPTTVDQLMEIADAGGIMPPKSTWFEPKLRDALLIHDLD